MFQDRSCSICSQRPDFWPRISCHQRLRNLSPHQALLTWTKANRRGCYVQSGRWLCICGIWAVRTISTLGRRHRRYLMDTHESLVSATSEGGLRESWSGHWACYSSWGSSRFCILGLPEPDTPRAYYIGSLLEVTRVFFSNTTYETWLRPQEIWLCWVRLWLHRLRFIPGSTSFNMPWLLPPILHCLAPSSEALMEIIT